MIRNLRLPIQCGTTTCHDGERFCRHVLTTHYGTRWVCGLFRRDDEQVELRDQHGGVEGSLQRCRECLAAEETP